ncbi:MAG TPA: fumarylacetoacetate hydrolase family protein, partial [Steroidobacteraceae bacterium]|nr:fumarylacetoacetate hydrolase family protein [Steroidobacteraceae bacterium]
AFPPRAPVAVAIAGGARFFPVHRVYCVGRNYAAHAAEMGDDRKEPPFFFSKPADAVVGDEAAVPVPPRTADFHHEVELVVALAGGGSSIPPQRALEAVFGYAVGIDYTRRDLQHAARSSGRPWDTSKGFDRSAAVGDIRPAPGSAASGGRIWLSVNGRLRQQADLADMTWTVPEIIAELSTLFELAAGDLIFTGTPAGVGPLAAGDRIEAGIDGIGTLRNVII